MLTGLILDGTKENSFRSQATNQQFGMLQYEEIPNGATIPISGNIFLQPCN